MEIFGAHVWVGAISGDSKQFSFFIFNQKIAPRPPRGQGGFLGHNQRAGVMCVPLCFILVSMTGWDVHHLTENPRMELAFLISYVKRIIDLVLSPVCERCPFFLGIVTTQKRSWCDHIVEWNPPPPPHHPTYTF